MTEKNQGQRLQDAFTTSTLSNFRFLVNDHGFSVDESTASSIKYSKSFLLITITWNAYAYEIDIDFRREDTGEEYSLYEVVAALAPSEEWQMRCSGADSVKMKRCMFQLSHLCRFYLQDFLTMDESTLTKVALSAKSMRTQYTLDAQYGAIKDRANEAWERKDWKKARELYEEAKPGLSATEERRLDFLLKKSF